MKTSQEDITAIKEVLNNSYFRGIFEGDVEALRKIYYPGALLFGDVKGQPYFKTLDEYLGAVGTRQSPKDAGKPFESEIISVEVVNSIARATVKVRMYDFVYHDMLSFHKLDGKWVIVNKMMSDINH